MLTKLKLPVIVAARNIGKYDAVERVQGRVFGKTKKLLSVISKMMPKTDKHLHQLSGYNVSEPKNERINRRDE